MTTSEATARFYKELWPHRAAMLRVARILTQSDADADDLAQDAMMRAYRGIEGLAPGTNAKGWLMTILRRTHHERARGIHIDELSLNALEIDPADQSAMTGEDLAAWGNPQETLAEFSDQEIIRSLKALPEEIRWTLLLVDVQGLDDQEAGEVLGVPTGTVKSRLHRGRRMLRDRLLPLIRARKRPSPSSEQKKEETY